MQRFFILLPFLFVSLFGTGQEKTDDNLAKLAEILEKPGDDTAKISAYIALTEILYYSNPDTVIPVSNLALQMIERLSHSVNKDVLHIFENQKANLYNNLGIVYDNKGDIGRALEYYLKALKIAEKRNEEELEAYLLVNIGYLYEGVKNYEAAEKSYMESIRISRGKGNYSILGNALNNLASLYTAKKEFDKSCSTHRECLDARKRSDDLRGMAITFNNLGFCEEKKENWSAARSFYFRSYFIMDSLKDYPSVVQPAINLSDVYFKEGKKDSALLFAEKAHSLALKLKFPGLIAKSAIKLSKTYESLGDHKKANSLLHLHIFMKDSLSNEELKKTTYRQQAKYEFDKREAVLKVEQEKREEEIKRQRLLNMFTAGGLMIVIVFAFFIFRSLKQNQAKSKIISQQKRLVEEKQKEILDSINYAQQIQKTLLANHEFVNETIPDSFVMFKPKDIVSGDFYWATKAGNRFYLAVCDSTGHGVPGAFMSLLNINYLNEAIKEKNITEPNEVFDHVRRRLTENISQSGRRDGMDGILICIESGKNTITYSAANNAPVIVSKSELKELKADKMPVGVGEVQRPFELFSFEYKKGDILYLYTDGFADQFGGDKGKKFKYRQLKEMLVSNSGKGINEQKEILESEFEKWKGNLEQVDDVCVIGVRL